VIDVIVVDDSAVVRKSLDRELSRRAGIDVVATAVDPYEARDQIVEHDPDVLTLDLEMPRMNGLTFLKQLMRHRPLPVVVVSSVAPKSSENALRALELGAVEVVPKPGSASSVPDVGKELVRSVRAAAKARPGRRDEPDATPAPSSADRATRPAGGPGVAGACRDLVLAIGASTGGTRAIESVLAGLPADIPPTMVVQHMSAGFTGPYAERLDRASPFAVEQARDGQPLEPGLVLVAPGDRHLLLRSSGSRRVACLRSGPPVNRHRPSVDALFRSVAEEAGGDSVAVLLTGMGDDGARGLKLIRDHGGRTVAQDEESSVVYGMPRAAAEMDAAEEIVSLDQMPRLITERIAGPAGRTAGPGR